MYPPFIFGPIDRHPQATRESFDHLDSFIEKCQWQEKNDFHLNKSNAKVAGVIKKKKKSEESINKSICIAFYLTAITDTHIVNLCQPVLENGIITEWLFSYHSTPSDT